MDTVMKEKGVAKTKFIFGFLVLLYASITCSYAADTISSYQTLRYNETIVSPQETFELGFFRPGNSKNLYVGIWFKKIPNRTIVWVANRNTPLSDTTCVLTLTHQGVLILRNAIKGNVLWSSANSTTLQVRNPIGQLLDTGNFIIYEEGDRINQEDPIWQSFDSLQHTLLPGEKLGWNLDTGKERHLTAWKSEDDPAFSEFSYLIDARGHPQPMITKGQEIQYRAGPWNGLRFSGAFNLKQNRIYNFTFVVDQREIYYQFKLVNTSVITMLVLQPSGHLERLLWLDNKKEWNVYLSRPIDLCDQYSVCGPFGICNIEKTPICDCLKGFEPTSPDHWRITDWSQGCRHTITLDCKPGEGFNEYSNLKLPDTRESWFNQTMTLAECEEMCRSNCSCTAYANSNIIGSGSGCLLWFGNLTDIRMLPENRDTIYIRLSASELDLIDNSRSPSVRRSAGRSIRVIVNVTFVVLGILVSICLFYWFYRKKKQQGIPGNEPGRDHENRSDDENLDLPLFGLSAILKATNNFSINNKLGEGGFGPVYKGVLEDGQEIAVKRLAKTSTQGLHEFKNEVISISKLQHRNLAKLLGCCIERSEKLLIYEYMPNKGLDSFIFDKTQSQRSEIGTYGYMAPEYAGDGIFSIKSDVYSFGVLVLEIVSGDKNRGFVHKEHCNNLIGHAWGLHNEGGSLQLVAKCLGESINVCQVLRSIHIALLCVQRHPDDRPTMTTVILMLGSESPLPSPKEPGFYVGKTKQDTTESSSSYGTSSTNELSISMLKGR
ncbi:hypothetical protein L1987_85050 [Smallanthus sonchifolius]|uniref:Uncharacterized protein n=1 Tax=Smallanthus sonchifolius TaxID=185202 RepID=A0ACB8XWM5_9ASTR|nr:hypothetical protein L1987_85050 [Smallanthus sonchifolius]